MIAPDVYNACFDARNSIVCATSIGSAILLKGDSSSKLSFSSSVNALIAISVSVNPGATTPTPIL